MNYIKLINAFYDRLETNSLSTSAIALWHALVHVNNKAGWQREFSVAVSVLCVKTGLSERTISNARNDLKMKGYLDFKSRKGSKSAMYSLVDLSATIADKVSDKGSDNDNEPKQNQKEDEDTTVDRILELLEKSKILEKKDITEFLRDDIDDVITTFGFEQPEEMIIEAIKDAARGNGRTWKFVYMKLVDWKKKGIKTKSDLETQSGEGEANGKKVYQHRTGYGRPSSKSAEQALREAEEARRAWGG